MLLIVLMYRGEDSGLENEYRIPTRHKSAGPAHSLNIGPCNPRAVHMGKYAQTGGKQIVLRDRSLKTWYTGSSDQSASVACRNPSSCAGPCSGRESLQHKARSGEDSVGPWQ